ncbi:MAG: ABC transporter ATPase [Bacteroidetes bacterium]|nr:MAG: ABC transporter ATPase [Bacteroidota bacterium]
MYSYRDLPETARIWIYQCNRELSAEEVKAINEKSEEFILDWSAHGAKLAAAIEIFYNLFVVVMVDEEKAEASGCSIDKSFQFIKELTDTHDLALLDRMNVAYRDNNKIQICRIDEFEGLLHRGEVSEDTIVFNNLVDTKKDFDSKWEVLLKDSWHRKLID